MPAADPQGSWLVTFAVPEEARPFLRRLRKASGSLNIRCRVTGMGAVNATRALQDEISRQRPAAVVTCGFAGGLDPRWPTGTVLWDADTDFPTSSRWKTSEFHRGTFHCAEKVAVTAEAKARLFLETRQDAVEMESGVIRRLCRAEGIVSATVRVISDAANEDLPLDFNRVVNQQMQIRFGRLVWELMKSPASIPRLIRFREQIGEAAERLADAVIGRTLLPGEHREV